MSQQSHSAPKHTPPETKPAEDFGKNMREELEREMKSAPGVKEQQRFGNDQQRQE